ncbi:MULTISPECIES: alpha/beta hydrolase [unclassified Sphingopyxis]|uniref:RBBP9/YdeN family alpha/beta hydrolase n=1 Tax=unclassified Sphingopyxis TaxID=2614943 RepID=UPI00285BBB3B|nr:MULTISPECIES: alpha/beta hydrolase [unclassified Sphingopyxis]MDR7060106.1 putative alpha/beta hydrolase family esterase [Sphingopyxis sp. BE235]MDR7180381.1 putative alpha/beta hydrolase family esterase [Sphingopyxis sp. BE249]
MHNSNIRHKILTIPGLYNSGPTHWQSLWERSFARCERIELGGWDEPVKDEWVEKIAAAIDAEHEPVLVAAHSLGCHAFAHWFAAASSVARDRIAGALLVAPPDLTQLRRDTRVESFTDSPPLSSQTPMIVVASDDDPYAKTSYVWRLSRHWDARFVNAGPFGHINADSGIADWPYGQYLLASLQPATTPALADEALWLRAGDWPNRVRRDPRFEFKERAHRS